MRTVRKTINLSPEEDKDIIDFLDREKKQSGSISNACRQALRIYMKYKDTYGDIPLIERIFNEESQPDSPTVQAENTGVQANDSEHSATAEPIKRLPDKPNGELLLSGSKTNEDEIKSKLLKGFQGY